VLGGGGQESKCGLVCEDWVEVGVGGWARCGWQLLCPPCAPFLQVHEPPHGRQLHGRRRRPRNDRRPWRWWRRRCPIWRRWTGRPGRWRVRARPWWARLWDTGGWWCGVEWGFPCRQCGGRCLCLRARHVLAVCTCTSVTLCCPWPPPPSSLGSLRLLLQRGGRRGDAPERVVVSYEGLSVGDSRAAPPPPVAAPAPIAPAPVAMASPLERPWAEQIEGADKATRDQVLGACTGPAGVVVVVVVRLGGRGGGYGVPCAPRHGFGGASSATLPPLGCSALRCAAVGWVQAPCCAPWGFPCVPTAPPPPHTHTHTHLPSLTHPQGASCTR
jgi:hypothetical protein